MEDTESVKAVKHQTQKQDNLNDPMDDDSKDLSTKEEQKPLPETVRCNPAPDAAWSVGTEVLPPTQTDDGLASEVEHCDIPDSKKEEDVDHKNEDDAARSQSIKEGEKGASKSDSRENRH